MGYIRVYTSGMLLKTVEYSCFEEAPSPSSRNHFNFKKRSKHVGLAVTLCLSGSQHPLEITVTFLPRGTDYFPSFHFGGGLIFAGGGAKERKRVEEGGRKGKGKMRG